MRFRALLVGSLLLTVGLVVHQFTPPILFGMKPDFLLAMMFAVLLLGLRPQEVLVIGVLSGILTAMTTSFPGGQIANMVDKPVTAFCVYLILLGVRKVPHFLRVPIVAIAGTFISGGTFLAVASLVTDLGETVPSLLLAVVLPAALVNTAALALMYPLISRVASSTFEATEVARKDKTLPDDRQ